MKLIPVSNAYKCLNLSDAHIKLTSLLLQASMSEPIENKKRGDHNDYDLLFVSL
jgi:hypothetical protein